MAPVESIITYRDRHYVDPEIVTVGVIESQNGEKLVPTGESVDGIKVYELEGYHKESQSVPTRVFLLGWNDQVIAYELSGGL